MKPPTKTSGQNHYGCQLIIVVAIVGISVFFGWLRPRKIEQNAKNIEAAFQGVSALDKAAPLKPLDTNDFGSLLRSSGMTPPLFARILSKDILPDDLQRRFDNTLGVTGSHYSVNPSESLDSVSWEFKGIFYHVEVEAGFKNGHVEWIRRKFFGNTNNYVEEYIGGVPEQYRFEASN